MNFSIHLGLDWNLYETRRFFWSFLFSATKNTPLAINEKSCVVNHRLCYVTWPLQLHLEPPPHLEIARIVILHPKPIHGKEKETFN